MDSLVRRKLIDSPPLDLRVSRRQLLQGAGAVVLAAVSRPTAVFGDDEPGNDEPLGPFSDWSEPVNLGPVVNSPDDDYHPAISKNGLSLYFASNRPGGVNGANKVPEIWVSQRTSTDADWGPPVNLGPVINSIGFNTAAPNFSPDGHHMFFHAVRLGGCGAADLYVSRRKDKRDDFGWQEPVNLGCTINSPFADNGPAYFEDEATGIIILYFTSNRPPGDPGPPERAHIHASTRGEDGNWGPGVFVSELNSPFFEGRPGIRRDGLEIFIPSTRPGGIDHSPVGIWVSTRENTMDPWSTPVNLGRPVNSEFGEESPNLSWDGTTMYFYSRRPGGSGGRDLWVTTRTKLHE